MPNTLIEMITIGREWESILYMKIFSNVSNESQWLMVEQKNKKAYNSEDKK